MARRRTLARPSFLALLTGFGLATLVCSSCGPKEQFPRKPVYPVRGQVFFQGKPAAGTVVFFRPVQDADDMAYWPNGYPSGHVAKDGTFQLSTYGAFDGAPAGAYAVSVTWLGERAEADPRRSRYPDPKTSGLRAEVKEGPNELEPFRLK